ncbi:MAG: alkyl hydroperoxide reductase [Planctomycetota bacterium]
MAGRGSDVVPVWMGRVLVAAAVYNLAWGTFVIFCPTLPFAWLGIAPPNYPGLWQCIGMIVGVYGIGYGLAAGNPVRHWPIVLVGLLGKIFGPIGFLNAAISGEFPWSAGWTIVTNDLIWWIPFCAILHLAWKRDPGSFPWFLQPRPPVSNRPPREHRDFAPRVSLSIPHDGQ